MKHILIIEDDPQINDMLKVLLTTNGYKVTCAYSGSEGLLVFDNTVDLVILDLMLPGKSGDEVIKEIKMRKKVPVIISSAVTDINKKIDLFALGADDYVTKPFDNTELLARISARISLYESMINKNSSIEYKDITLDVGLRTASCNNCELNLSKIEFDILSLFIKNNNITTTKSMIYDIIWDYDSGDDNALNVHVSSIRKKLKKCNPSNDYIETVWGVGYRMCK